MSETVRRLEVGDVDEVVDVLCESFFDYPVMRYVLGTDDDYGGRIRTLVGLFAMSRVLRGEPMLGAGDGPGLRGVAIVSRPADASRPRALSELRERVWTELGADARERYAAYSHASDFPVAVPHLHLGMIGVRATAQGTGLGRALIEGVHAMSKRDPASTGVSLTTESPGNVSLYRHFGYELLDERIVSPELTTWGFFRPDEGA